VLERLNGLAPRTPPHPVMVPAVPCRVGRARLFVGVKLP
jgi:hypothetical protein